MNITRDRNERKTDEPRRVESHIPTPESQAQEVHQIVDIHIYNEVPQEEETQSIEETTGTVETTLQPARKRVTTPFKMTSLVLLILLIIGGGYLVYSLLFVQSVTVTIVPTLKKVQASVTVTIATGTPVPDSVPGRVLPALTMSQALTVPTTGMTYQSAQPGRGTITFYNSALFAQTIVAGTLITAKDGTQVVTDSVVTVPAGTLATNGQAVITGYSSNVLANDIYGPCCLLDIQAQNSAFSGGVPAQTYQSVAKTDIDTAVSKLQTTLNQSVIAAFQTQVQSSQTLVTPPMCQPTIGADHQIGDRATQVQVTVSNTCTGLTYYTRAMQQHVSQIQPLAHYRLLGTVQTTLQSVVAGNTLGTYTLTVQSTALWSYQFTQKEMATIAAHIKGMSTHDATRYLLHTTGVRHISFSSDGNLPTDSSKIRFLFLT